ncbi:MAG: DUF4256 domain-containing protein [Bacteroidia bacterium]
MSKSSKNQLTIDLREEILSTLKQRFEKNQKRHTDIEWSDVAAKLEKNEDSLYALYQMEKTGGEPDVVGQDKKTGKFLFYDCSPETPSGRRSICYDREALDSRKKFKPATSAMDMANEMGVEILDEEEYRALQKLGKFDSKTSSWLKTPDSIRKLGGAIFADYRFDHIFIYHNGAESYYGARGFRACLKV